MHEPDYFDYCFDSAIHYGSHIYLAFSGWVSPFGSWHPNPVTSISFMFSNWVDVFSTLSSGVQRRGITKFFKGAGAPLTDLFLKVLEKGMTFGLSMWIGLKSQIHSNIPIAYESESLSLH